MQYTRSASAGYILGEVDPSWHSPEVGTDFAVRYKFRSHDEAGNMSYPVLDQEHDGATPNNICSEDLAVSGVQQAIREIDTMIRVFRDYDETQVTEISASYRSGVGRATSVTGMILGGLQSMVRTPIRFIPSGPVHFDRFGPPDDHETGDSVILSRSQSSYYLSRHNT